MAGRAQVPQGEPASVQERRPFRFRLPAFVQEEAEVGLGDVIKRSTYAAGIPPCAKCRRRASALNRRVVFTR